MIGSDVLSESNKLCKPRCGEEARKNYSAIQEGSEMKNEVSLLFREHSKTLKISFLKTLDMIRNHGSNFIIRPT